MSNKRMKKKKRPLEDNVSSFMMTFEVFLEGEIQSIQEAQVKETPPPKLPKTYDLRSKGLVGELTLEEKNMELLRKISPPNSLD